MSKKPKVTDEESLIDVLGEGDDFDLEYIDDGMLDDGSDFDFAVESLGEVFKVDPEFDKRRTGANHEILVELSDYMRKNPSLRFGQALVHLGLATEDLTVVEPTVQMQRIKKALLKLNK